MSVPPPAPEAEIVTFWDITRQQFAKNRPAMAALYCVLGLIALATAAPLIAMNVPYLMQTPEGTAWPLFGHLFDQILFPSGVDIFFNLFLILGPFWWLGGGFAAALLGPGGLDRRRALGYGVPFALLVGLCVLWSFAVQSCYPWLLGFGLLGTLGSALQTWRMRRHTPRARRRIRLQTRAGLGLLFAVAFILILYPLSTTRPLVTYRTVVSQLEKRNEGWALEPPIFFHPDNKGEESAVVNARILKPPSLKSGNLLGTDNNGRDVFARIVYGTRISLTIGLIAVSIYTLIGLILGSLAGYFGGRLDMLIVGLLQVMLCIPWIFLLLTIIAVFDTRSIFMIMVAIGLTGWPGITRLVRGEFFRQRSIDYVTAAVALGLPKRRIIFGHILKNSVGPVLVAVAFGVASAILAESFISFLGLWDTNAPSWGQILMQGRNQRVDWLILSPGMAIFFVVTILNLVGDGLRDAIDPKLRQ